MKVYVVEALRFGDREKHSLVVGVYANTRLAALSAVAYEYWRGGKYTCEITEVTLDGEPGLALQQFLDDCIDAEQQQKEIESKIAAIKVTGIARLKQLTQQ